MKKDKIDNEDDELWEEGAFIETLSPAEIKEKMKTFHMKHDEDMNYNCRICKFRWNCWLSVILKKHT